MRKPETQQTKNLTIKGKVDLIVKLSNMRYPRTNLTKEPPQVREAYLKKFLQLLEKLHAQCLPADYTELTEMIKGEDYRNAYFDLLEIIANIQEGDSISYDHHILQICNKILEKLAKVTANIDHDQWCFLISSDEYSFTLQRIVALAADPALSNNMLLLRQLIKIGYFKKIPPKEHYDNELSYWENVSVIADIATSGVEDTAALDQFIEFLTSATDEIFLAILNENKQLFIDLVNIQLYYPTPLRMVLEKFDTMDKNKNKLTNFIRSLFKDWNGHYDLRDSTGKPLLSILNANHSNCIDRIIVLDKERIAASYFIARLFEQKTRLLTEEITAPDDTTYNILNVQGAVDYLTNEDFKNLRRHTKGSLLLNSIKVLEKHKKTKTDNNLLYKLIIVSQKYATELFSEDDNMQIIVKKLALLKDHINENTQVLIEILNQTEKSPIKSPIKSILCLFWSTLVTFIEKIQSKKDKEYSQKAL